MPNKGKHINHNPNSKKNLIPFSPTHKPSPEAYKRGAEKRSQRRKEEKAAAAILKRLLDETVTIEETGQQMTAKEYMLYGVLTQAMKNHDLKAVELVLKLIGELSDQGGVNVGIFNQQVKDILPKDIEAIVKQTMKLADEG